MRYDLALEVRLAPAGGGRETVISRTNCREMYYSATQQIAHHAIGGCKMEAGDLIGSGTVSGPMPGSEGSLLEITQGGKVPLRLDDGSTRTFREVGERVTLADHAQGDGYRIGFGTCSGTEMSAVAFP